MSRGSTLALLYPYQGLPNKFKAIASLAFLTNLATPFFVLLEDLHRDQTSTVNSCFSEFQC